MRVVVAAPLYVYRKVDEYPLYNRLSPIRVTVDYAKASLRGHRYTMLRLLPRRRSTTATSTRVTSTRFER